MIARARRVLVIATGAGFTAALAQPSRDLVPVEREQRLLDEIDELREEGGSHAEGLIAPLRALGVLYQEAGDHTPAVVALREARQVLRANHGLFSSTVDEALLLRQQVRSEKALGRGEQAWNLQHDMIIIARQHLDDMRMLPIFVELIEDRTGRLDAFSTTDYKDLPPGLYVPCETGPMPTPVNSGRRAAPVPVLDARACALGTWRTVVTRLHAAVLRNYADAIAILIRNGDYGSQELRDLEKRALDLVPFERGFLSCPEQTFIEFLESDLVGSCMDTAGGAGVGGWASLMRLVFYEVRSGAPAGARANAFAELGDWYLRAEHVSHTPKFSPADEIALSLYEQAFVELRQGDAAHELAAEIFSPGLPVTLPTYAPNPLASTESSRFIDVAFAITTYGKADHVEISRSSENVARAEERDLLRVIKYSSFRPRGVDGALVDSAPVVMRYYLPENRS